MSSPSSLTKPLANRSPNKSLPPSKNTSIKPPMATTDAEKKPQSMEYHRQMLQNKLQEEKSQQQYISPSDTIMSPCTAKLSAYKSKRFGKAKPQSLFAKMDSSKSGIGASDGKSDEEKLPKDGSV